MSPYDLYNMHPQEVHHRVSDVEEATEAAIKAIVAYKKVAKPSIYARLVTRVRVALKLRLLAWGRPKMIRSLIVIAALVACGSATAGELLIHMGSLHSTPRYTYTHTTNHHIVDPDPGTGNVVVRWGKTTTQRTYNNLNYGIGWRADNGWSIGTYHNSFSKPTVYFGKAWTFGETNFGVFVGAATGYEVMNGRKLQPIGAFEYKLNIQPAHGIRFALIPKIGNHAAVLHTGLSKQF